MVRAHRKDALACTEVLWSKQETINGRAHKNGAPAYAEALWLEQGTLNG